MKTITIILALFIFLGEKYKPLRYEDFKGHGPLPALTTSEINLNEVEVDGRYKFSVSVNFVPNESYINVRTPEILSHENTHWLITQLYGKSMQRVCDTFVNCNEKTAEGVRKIYNHIMSEWEATESKFDEETNHSLNRAAELEWERKIAKEIQP